MKKAIFCLFLLALLTNACRKSTVNSNCGEMIDLQLQSNQVFVIGSSGGFGGSGRGTYKIKNGQLFLVLTRGDSLLPNERFLVANVLSKEFPKEMKDTPNKNWLGNCNDSFGFFIEIESTNGTKQSWSYEPCGQTNAPDFARCYFDKAIKTMFTP